MHWEINASGAGKGFYGGSVGALPVDSAESSRTLMYVFFPSVTIDALGERITQVRWQGGACCRPWETNNMEMMLLMYGDILKGEVDSLSSQKQHPKSP